MDEGNFAALYERHVADVWRFVRRRTSSAAEADDATAEVFGVAWRRRSDLPAEDGVRLWLFGTARRVLANQRRSAGRWARLQDRVAVVSPPTHEPDAAAVARLDPDDLWVALAALDPADRDLLLLRAWDGLAVAEIAELLGCTANAASIRLHRARARLADHLGTKGDERPRTSPGRTPNEGGGR